MNKGYNTASSNNKYPTLFGIQNQYAIDTKIKANCD